MALPTQGQLDLAARLGISPEALEGLDRGQMSRVLDRAMSEGGERKLKEEAENRRKRVIEERGLEKGVVVTTTPNAVDPQVYRIKVITSDGYIRLEKRPGNWNPNRIYPVPATAREGQS